MARNPATPYEYVQTFERNDRCLPNSWITVRVTGHEFVRFAEIHQFEVPNERRHIDLMNKAAVMVMEELRDICLAFAMDFECSFIIRKDSSMYNRSQSKLLSLISSFFTGAYIHHWREFFLDVKLTHTPAFGAKLVVYPSDQNLRDFLSWRQTELKFKHMYSTLNHFLVTHGFTQQKVTDLLKGATSAQSIDNLFSQHEINYLAEPEIHTKGTTLLRKLIPSPEDGKLRHCILPIHGDLNKEEFWKEHSEILGLKSLQVCNKTVAMKTYYVTKFGNAKREKLEGVEVPAKMEMGE